MSGGFFDNKDFQIRYIAEDIEKVIQNNNIPDENGYECNFTPKTLRKLAEAVKILRLAEIYTHRIDWLMSDDDGEEEFHKALKEEIKNIKKHYQSPQCK